MTFLSGQRLTAEALNLATKRLIARGTRTSDKAAITAEVGVLRLDDIPLVGGRSYLVQLGSMRMGATAATVTARLRVTTDGSTPTTASTAIAAYILLNSTSAESFDISRAYYPATDETFSVLFTLASTVSISTSGAASDSPIQLSIFDTTEDTGDIGVDI